MAARDIVVIGAGIVGCAVACELAGRGASVEVVDMREAGQGATRAAAGMLAPYVEAHEESPLLALAVRSLGLYDEFVAAAARDSGLSIPYRRTGTLEVAVDEERMHRLRARGDALRRRGIDAAVLDGAAARAEEPHLSRGAIGGLLIPSHGCVSAGILVAALAGAARRRGAQILGHGAVRRVARDGDGLRVETDRGSLKADGAVIAAGSWSGSIAIEGAAARVPVRPVRGQLLQLRWTGTPLRRITWSERCYQVPWDDGTVLVGATSEEAGFDERATAAGVHDLLNAACEIVPHGWTAGFVEARVGLRPASPDGLPIIGASRALPTVMYATGHYRNGILLAPVTAALVADAMLDDRLDALLTPLAPSRFGDL